MTDAGGAGRPCPVAETSQCSLPVLPSGRSGHASTKLSRATIRIQCEFGNIVPSRGVKHDRGSSRGQNNGARLNQMVSSVSSRAFPRAWEPSAFNSTAIEPDSRDVLPWLRVADAGFVSRRADRDNTANLER
jgi:hypothetical protein